MMKENQKSYYKVIVGRDPLLVKRSDLEKFIVYDIIKDRLDLANKIIEENGYKVEDENGI